MSENPLGSKCGGSQWSEGPGGSLAVVAVFCDVLLEPSMTFVGSRPVIKEDGGQASALNDGFERTTGDWITLLDSDDVFHDQQN